MITDHPFEPAVAFRDAWPGICGRDVDGLPCGYSRDEHATYPRPLDPPDGQEPDRSAEYERLRAQRAAIDAEAAKLRELYEKLETAKGEGEA